jgi:hypothetical protein
MMDAFSGIVNNVMVSTTSNRGRTPEEVAEQALDKIIHVSGTAPPVIAEQANVFRENIRIVLVHYMREAVRSHNTTLAGKMVRAGHPELVTILDS